MTDEHFTIEEFEIFNNEIMKRDREYYLNIYEKLANVDAAGSQQSWILLSKLGDLALKHKQIILQSYVQMIREHIELMREYIRVMEAAAGNISPAGDLTAIISAVLHFIQLSTLLTQLGTFQGDFRIYAEKPLLAYISDVLQETESIRDDNLNPAYSVLKNAIILPDKILR